MAIHELPRSSRSRGRPGLLTLVGFAVLLLIFARGIAQLVIEYAWWREAGQIETWENIILYSFAPILLATVAAFVVLWVVHARALKFAGTSLRDHRSYARLSSLVLLVLSFLVDR